MATSTNDHESQPKKPSLDYNPRTIQQPYEMLAELRRHDPVHWTGQSFAVTRYADFITVHRDPRFGRQGMLRPTKEGDPPPYFLPMLFCDPPDHTRLRGLVNRAFTLRIVDRLRPHIERNANELLDKVDAKGSFELVGDFAYHLPMETICALLGMPDADHARIHELALGHADSLIADPRTEKGRADIANGHRLRKIWAEYFEALSEERRRDPREDIISGLVQANADGEKLTTYELVATCMGLLFAGHTTTADAMGNGVVAFMRHRDQWERVVKEPELIDSAVNEVLRYDTPVQADARLALEDAELGGVPIKKGSFMVALNGAANHDPEVFPDPERFDITRDSKKHVAFGFGIHRCLGSTLALEQLKIAFLALIRRYPNMRMASEPVWRPNPIFRGLSGLEIERHPS